MPCLPPHHLTQPNPTPNRHGHASAWPLSCTHHHPSSTTHHQPPTHCLGVGRIDARSAGRPGVRVGLAAPESFTAGGGAPITHVMSSGGEHLFDLRTPVPLSNVCSATGGLPRPPTPCTVIICVGDVWFFGIAGGDGRVGRVISPPSRCLLLDSLRFVYGRGITTGVGTALTGSSVSCFRASDRVRRRVGGMGVEPRFRGLMARTVLLVYTLFELRGS